MKNSKLLNRIFLKAGLFTMMLVLLLTPAISSAATFNTTMKFGSRSSEVTALQSYLAQDSTLYPEGIVTGYFGSLTKAAVIRFQSRNGLPADGIVGPLTRSILNGGQTNNGQAPMISNVSVSPSRNSATVNFGINTPAQGKVYYSATPLTTYEYENSVDVSGTVAMTDTSARTSQSVMISGLNPGTTYYYLIYTTGQNGNVSVSWPSTFTTSN